MSTISWNSVIKHIKKDTVWNWGHGFVGSELAAQYKGPRSIPRTHGKIMNIVVNIENPISWSGETNRCPRLLARRPTLLDKTQPSKSL